MKKGKKLFSLFLAVIFVFSMLPAMAFAAIDSIPDMPDEGHWSYAALCAAVENGLLKGDKAGRLTPEDSLTRAQMATVINRAFGAIETASISKFVDMSEEAWYAEEIAKAVRMGTFQGDGSTMRPDAPISRQEAFAVLARAFKLEDGSASALDRFPDSGDVAPWAVPELAAMVEADYVHGSDGRLNPQNEISRAEFAQVMYNMLRKYYSEAGTYSEVLDGNQMINVPDVTLKDMTVSGDLIVGEGVGDGDIWLDNVKVEGRLLVRGGGENSIHIVNKSSVGSILVSKTGDGGVRVCTEEGCRVEAVNVADGKDDVILEGEFNQVVINTDAPVILNDADVTGLTVKAENADVKLEGETGVSAVSIEETAMGAALDISESAAVTTLDSAADSVTVSGSGTLTTATVSGDDTTVNTLDTSLTVESGAEGVMQNGSAVEAGETVITGSETPSTGGGEVVPVHSHSWDAGTVTTEPTCTADGVKTFACACGETMTEAVPALGHDWDEGTVTKEPADGEDGELTFTCRRAGCGETKTEVISGTPFSIFPDEELGIPEKLLFATFEEAMAEAAKYEARKPAITVSGYAELADVTIPAGYQLIAEDATLKLTGCTFAPGTDALSDGELLIVSGSKVYLDETQLTGDGGAIQYESVPGEHIELVSILGAEGETLPALALLGVYGATDDETHVFTVEKSLALPEKFCGLHIGDNTEVTVANGACLTVGNFGIGFDSFLRVADGSLDFGGITIGTTAGSGIRMPESGEIVLGNDWNGLAASLIGGNVEMSGTFAVRDANLDIRPAPDGGADCTLTVKSGADITLCRLNLADDLIIESGAVLTLGEGVNLEESCTVTNNGTLKIESDVSVSGTLNNAGTLELSVSPDDNGDYRCGRLNVIGAGAALTNSGTINVVGQELEGNGYRCGEVIFDGAAFTNAKAGVVNNQGNFSLYTRSTRYVKRGDGDFEKECDASASSFRNDGTIRNQQFGNMQIDCNDAMNNGTIQNDEFLLTGNYATMEQQITLQRVPFAEPDTDACWEEFWSSFDSWDAEEGYYWKNTAVTVRNVQPLNGMFTNFGTVINNGSWFLPGACLMNGADAEIQNNSYMELSPFMAFGEDAAAAMEGVTFPEPAFRNAGEFTNGAVTAVGESDNGSNANFFFRDGSFENSGSVTANGFMGWENVDYTQTASATLENYNAGGLEIYGGSLTVPGGAVFKNEGYMRIVDRYGEAYSPCNLSGFADFFTTWNQDGNDSQWCDISAEVYDLTGYNAAVAAQNSRSDSMKYNRLDFVGDITFTGNVTFADFREYWLSAKPGEDGQPPVGATMTVAAGATLTIASGHVLMVDGVTELRENEQDGVVTRELYRSPNKLVVKGRLVIQPNIPEEWSEDGERIRDYVHYGEVQIWGNGSFDATGGTVENNGIFEVRYLESGDISADGDFRIDYNGESFARPAGCLVAGAPQNATFTAEVRTGAGLKTAIGNSAPVFNRILIRDDCTVTVAENLTIPNTVKEVCIDPASGLTVEYGSTLTLNCEGFENMGDVHIYGDLIVNGEFRNNQNVEVGALSGNEAATITVNGALMNWNTLNVYETGSIDVKTGARLEAEQWDGEERIFLPVKLAAGVVPGFARGILFTEPLTLSSAPEQMRYEFDNCRFEAGITVVYTAGHETVEVEFFDNCEFGEDAIVSTAESGVNDYMDMNDRICIMGAKGAVVESKCPVNVSSGWGGESFTLNGVTAAREGGDYCVSLRFDEWDDTNHPVFQADSNAGNALVLTGELNNAEELRLQQGNIDITGLTVYEGTVIRIHDEFQPTEVSIGSYAVEVEDGWNQEGFFGYTIHAAQGADILIRNAQLIYDGNYEGTMVNVVCGDQEYEISAHIFGVTGGGDPAVYVAGADSAIGYELLYNEDPLTFTKKLIAAEDKTHLEKTDGEAWFTASKDDVPFLMLFMALPEGVKVGYESVPLKPEWDEAGM